MRWSKATLGECATLVNGRAYKQEELLDSGTPVLRIQNLNGGDRWYFSNLSLPQDKYCDKGDLLFAWSASFGPYLWNGPTAIYHYHIWKVLPGRLLDKGFLYHLLGFLTARVKSESHGASMLHMTKARMEALEIPLPPLEEQRRIAAILDKVNSIKLHAQARDNALESFEHELFHFFFGSCTGQANRWDWQAFGSLCSRLTVGVVVKPASYYREKGVPALRSLNVKPGAILKENFVYVSDQDNCGALSKSKLIAGDLVFVRSGRPGTCAVIPRDLDGCNAIDLLLATTNSDMILPEFASSYFNSASGRASILFESRGQVQQHFNAGSLNEALLPVPPIDLQQRFCKILEHRRNQAIRSVFSMSALNILSRTLSTRLFLGAEG